MNLSMTISLGSCWSSYQQILAVYTNKTEFSGVLATEKGLHRWKQVKKESHGQHVKSETSNSVLEIHLDIITHKVTKMSCKGVVVSDIAFNQVSKS